MGDALLFGGSSGGGIRNKSITKYEYENLSEEEKSNPYIIWIITDEDGHNFLSPDGDEMIVKAIHYETYCGLSEDDRNDPNVVWLIVDLDESDYSILNMGSNTGSIFYDIGGLPTSTKRIIGVDYKLSTESHNPVANYVLTNKINELENRFGGLSFSVNETGGLRITYDDGVRSGEE